MRIVPIAFAASFAALPAMAAPGDILAANKQAEGDAALEAKAAVRIDADYAGQGLTGKVHTLEDLRTGAFVDDVAAGPVKQTSGFDGAHAWTKDQSGAVSAQDGGEAAPIAVNDAYRRANLWWRPDFGGAAISEGAQTSDAGHTYDVLTVTPKSGKNFDAWFDTKSHLLSRVVEVQAATPTTTTYSDYRAVEGAMLPYKMVIGTGDPKYDQVMTVTMVAFLPAQDDVAFAKPSAAFTDTSIAGGAKETTVKFQLINNHVYAPVTVNGKGPYLFIFDTGGVNAVTPTLEKEAGLTAEGKMEARGAGSGSMEAGFAKVKSIQIGDATIKDQTVLSIGLDTRTSITGFTDLGMIGFETYRRFVTRFDYGNSTLTLIDPKAFDPKDAGTPVHLDFSGNVPEIEATFDGIKGKFEIDTGNRGSLVVTAPFVAAHHLRDHAGKGIDATTGWGVGGPTKSFAYRGGDLNIGGIDVKDGVIYLSTDSGGAMASADMAGNIGGGVLKRFVVTLDYEHSTMYLKPVTGAIADLDTFDRSGMWINKDPAGFKIVDVSTGAPAAEAGLKADEIVTAVDGKPAAAMSLSDFRRRLRSDAPGTAVTLGVKGKGDVKITLRDLI